MFADQCRAAVDGARSLTALEPLARALWQAFGAGAVTEADAEALSGLIEARKALLRADGAGKPVKAALGPTAARRIASYNRGLSFERRRRLAASGPLPPFLAAKFTVGELATLRIVRDEVSANGACERTLGEIAARAGVSASTARNAMRLAARLGLVTIEERRVAYDRNLPNLVRVVSSEWLSWIAKGTHSPTAKGGCKKLQPTDIPITYGQSQGLKGTDRTSDPTRRYPQGDRDRQRFEMHRIPFKNGRRLSR